MVRHPFERSLSICLDPSYNPICRLVSAYQDKVVDGSDSSYARVRYNLLRRYGEVSFANFVHQILDRSPNNCR